VIFCLREAPKFFRGVFSARSAGNFFVGYFRRGAPEKISGRVYFSGFFREKCEIELFFLLFFWFSDTTSFFLKLFFFGFPCSGTSFFLVPCLWAEPLSAAFGAAFGVLLIGSFQRATARYDYSRQVMFLAGYFDPLFARF